MTPTPALLLAAGLGALLVGAGAAGGMVYAPISDADLLARADRVVLGRVLDARPGSGGGMPSLVYEVEVEESLVAVSGASDPARLDVEVPGGRRDDGLGMWIAGTPRLLAGDEVLLFLVDDGDGPTRLVEHTLGLFHVVELGGRRLAVRSLGDAVKVFTADTEGLAAGGLSKEVERREEWPRDLETFTGWLRRAGDGAHEATYEIDPSSLDPAFGDKFALLISRSDDSFGSCGELGGLPVRRFQFDDVDAPQTVGWRMHFTAPAGAATAFTEALAVWTAEPATPVDYDFDGLTSANGVLRRADGVNTLMFGDPFDDIPGVFDGSGILALGGPWFYCEHSSYHGLEYHAISEGDIVVQNGVSAAFAATPWPDRLLVQLLAHELGHTLGIGHTDEVQALMQAVLHFDPRGAAHEPDDLAALAFLYGGGGIASETPRRPDGLQAEAERGPFVQLSWEPVEGASNYRIERRRPPGSFELLTSVIGTGHEDLFVETEAVYDYRLRAQNAAGFSGSTDPVRVTTGEDGQPAAPSQLRYFPLDEHGVGLRWQSNACDAESVRLEVSIAGSAFRLLQTPIGGAETEVLVTGLNAAETYQFRISGQNRWGISPTSEPVAVEPLESDGTCVWYPGDPHLCLADRRYQVTLEHWNETLAAWQAAVPSPDQDRRGFFSFFDTGNVELELSLEAGPVGPVLHWTSLTDRAWRAEVLDTVTGESWMAEPHVPLCIGSVGLGTSSQASLEVARPKSDADPSLLALDPAVATKAIDPEVPCGRSPYDLYLRGGRFRARLAWWDGNGQQRQARAFDLTDTSGGFELGTTDELGWMVKLLDGRGANGRFWLFASPMRAAAAFEAELAIEDLVTGVTRTYGRPRPTPGGDGEFAACGTGDVAAFADP